MEANLTIIIVNWNTKEMLQHCIQSILTHQSNLKVEIIVVDNASRDQSSEMLANLFPDVRLIKASDNLGFAKANNLAIPIAQAPLVLFLNPDTMVQRDSLQRMTTFLMANDTVGALGCKMINLDGKAQDPGLQWETSPMTKLAEMVMITDQTGRLLSRLLPFKTASGNGEVSWVNGGCLLVRKTVLDQVGPFDERFFMYAEDADICARIRQAGWKIYYLSDAEIIHVGGGASKGAASQFSTLMMCESISKFVRKHQGTCSQAIYRVAVLLGALFRLCLLVGLRLSYRVVLRPEPKKYRAATSKYNAMVKWSLGLARPIIRK